jgi:cytochrome d ubiquinol oxidase subunit II
MLESVAVGWDGNETWLILLGVALWAGFPLAFGTILPNLYLPMIVVLFSLIVRGVSVEMASQAPPAHGWIAAFGIASLFASFGQGFALGTLTSTLHIDDGAFSGSAFGAFGWFPVLTGVTVTAAYAALGYAHTKQKSTGLLRASAGRRGLTATALTAALLIAVLFAMNATVAPLNLHSLGRAFAFGGLLIFAAAGTVTSLVSFPRKLPSNAADTLPINGLVVAIVAMFFALVVARYPVIAPPALTVDSAVGPHNTMVFVLVGIGLNMPLVLGYNVFAHRAFRGKLDNEFPSTTSPVSEESVASGARS